MVYRTFHLLNKERSRKSRYFAKYKLDISPTIPQLERQGADMETRFEELEMVNQSLRNRDKPKEGARIIRPTYAPVNKITRS